MILTQLKQLGQVLSKDLACKCGLSESALNKQLYPLVVGGHVMACDVYQGSKKIGTEYRLTGTFPRARPGPKSGGERKTA